ncbi:MAG TPA: hypothetical protein VKB38_15880 [Terracidiphilus sp.]|nr:hypothetical protein [Terracidiphilus sp.]
MDVIKILPAIAYLTLIFFLYALPFAALPAGVLAAGLSPQGRVWMCTPIGEGERRKIPYFRLCLLGGLGGEILAIASLAYGEEWICYTRQQLCNDGQGVLVFIFTIPVFSLIGSVAALGWTWLSLRISENTPWSSIFRYSGPNRSLNWACAITAQTLIWLLAGFCAFRTTIWLVFPW